MKKEPSLPTEHLDLSDSFAEHPIVVWISHNGRTLLWILAALFAFFLIYFRMTGGRAATESEYMQADTYFQQLQKGSTEAAQTDAYQKLAAILKKHPELQAKYDGQLAQIFLNKGDLPTANDYALRTLDRTASDHLTVFADYSRTTLLLADKKYEESLAKALSLKQQLQSSPTDPALQTLYLFDLLRIAMIQQQLGQREAELKAWEELRQATAPKAAGWEVDPEIYEQFVTELGSGQASLLKYIEAREKNLKL